MTQPNSDSGSKQVLNEVDKADKYNKRIVELFDELEWTRDNFERNYEEVWNTYKTIEELIKDLNTELEYKDQKLSQKIDDFGDTRIEKLERKNFDKDHSPTLIHYKTIGYEDMRDIDQRIKEYKAYQEALMKGVAEKLKMISQGYRKDFVGSKVHENTVEAAKDKIEDEMEKVEQRLENKLQRKTSGLEASMDAMRTELKFYRNYIEQHGEVSNDALRKLSDDVCQLTELVEDIQDSGFQEIPTDERGRTTLDSDTQERMEKQHEQESAMKSVNTIDTAQEETETSSENNDEPDDEQPIYEIKGEDVEDQYDILQKAVAKHDLVGAMKKEIAAHFDVSPQAIFKTGGILDRIEEQHGTRFGLD